MPQKYNLSFGLRIRNVIVILLRVHCGFGKYRGRLAIVYDRELAVLLTIRYVDIADNVIIPILLTGAHRVFA